VIPHVGGDKVDLGVSVLSGLGGGHVNDLAWSSLDQNVTVLSEGRALHAVAVSAYIPLPRRDHQHHHSRVGLGGTGSGSLEGLVVFLVRHG
jgi:hypothetical protein